MSLEIRPARASDVDALLAIEHAAFAGDRLSRRSLRQLVAARSAIALSAVADDVVAGYCLVLLRSGSRIARLYSIAVAPGRRGIGRPLLERAEAAARTRGAAELRLEVRADNARAVALYEACGYAAFGSRPGYYHDGQAAIRFRKTLASETLVSEASVPGMVRPAPPGAGPRSPAAPFRSS
ncbi:MAG: GNAT family N-acetyltransferase [Rhizobiaceae bacterium]|nr:GNAT family N-acetyltransferase [Rhizobiaceae bacterium]